MWGLGAWPSPDAQGLRPRNGPKVRLAARPNFASPPNLPTRPSEMAPRPLSAEQGFCHRSLAIPSKCAPETPPRKAARMTNHGESVQTSFVNPSPVGVLRRWTGLYSSRAFFLASPPCSGASRLQNGLARTNEPHQKFSSILFRLGFSRGIRPFGPSRRRGQKPSFAPHPTHLELLRLR